MNTERLKGGTLLFLNVKLLPNNGEDSYVSFFKELLKMDYAVKDRGDKFITLLEFIPCPDFLENKRNYGKYKLWRGCFLEYTDLDPNGFINTETKESINKPFTEDNIGANQKRGYFYFVPEAHRLVILKNTEIGIKKIKKYIEEAGERLNCEKQDSNTKVCAIIETTKDALKALQQVYAVIRIKAKLSYTNKDHSVDFERIFDEKLTNSGATEVDMNLIGSKQNPLNLEEDSLAASIVNISESNGDLEAKIMEHKGDKIKPFNTEEYNRAEPIKYRSSELPNIIYNKIMSIFRNTEKE